MKTPASEVHIPLPTPLYRGARRLRLALIGLPNGGKSTLFRAVSSTEVNSSELTGTQSAYGECTVQIGLNEVSVVDLPSIQSLTDSQSDDLVTLKYLLWGDELPPVSAHEPGGPPAPFSPPDVIIQVIDATSLDRHLELTLELIQLGRPLVLVLNMMDVAQQKGLHISARNLSKQLGVPVVATTATRGHGIMDVFNAAIDVARQQSCPVPQSVNKHISDSLQPLSNVLQRPDIYEAFRIPHPFLLMQLAAGDHFLMEEMRQHFPELMPTIMQLRAEAAHNLPRPLADEIHADRHHRAAMLFEAVTRIGAPHEGRGWRYWLDELFLHPQGGLLGSLVVFALVLFVVFEVSAWIDSFTSARLIEWSAQWQTHSTFAVVVHAVADGLIGLAGIVIPYMLPLVMLLVALEQIGIMQRIAFVVDRGFHKIGLHGNVAVPLLMGLGCNVPAIAAAGRASRGRERIIAALLITFTPCSARSAVILALAGKYLGGLGVFAIFALSAIIIAILGRLLLRRYPESGPGEVLEIPAYGLPSLRPLLRETWARTRDIVTIVTPLLVSGSVVLALLNHFGADTLINAVLTPITHWWLGLPLVLGVPILFGVLRKELSLLMIYQALGTFEIGTYMDWLQIITFLLFLTFYVPCVSTFAVMVKTIGRREAFFSVALSVGVALLVSGVVRLVLEVARYLFSS